MVEKSSLITQALRQYREDGDRSEILKRLQGKNLEFSETFLKEQESMLSDDSPEVMDRKHEYLKAYFYLMVNEDDSYMRDYIQKYCRPKN